MNKMKVYLDDLEEIEINKVYFGDCYELIKKIPDKSIDCIYTDPPYLFGNVNKGSFGERNPMITKKTKNQIEKLSHGIDYKILDEFVRVLKKIHVYIWCNDKQIIDYMNYFVNEKGCDYMVLGWNKTNPMPMFSKRMLDDVEYCLVFSEKGHTKFRGVDTYENSFKFQQEPINLKDKLQYDHPTIKPLQMVKNHIEKATQENDIILDPFFGSGTTGEACLMTNRNFIGIENDAHYFKIAQDRLNGITQQEVREKEKGILNIFDFIEGET